MQGALNGYAKIFSVNIIAGFLNVLNQLIEPRMENFVFFSSKMRIAYPEILTQKFVFYPGPWKHLCGIEISQYFSW